MRKRQNYAWRNEMASDHFSIRRRNFEALPGYIIKS
jgi:hypothetical protein